MKEFGYVINLMRDGKMFNFEVKIEEEKVSEFLRKISVYRDFNYKGYIKIILIYVQDMETLEKEYLYTDIVNELKHERTKKQALARLDGERIDYNAVAHYLNYNSPSLANVLYIQHDDYKFILDSSNIEYICDVDIVGFEVDMDILTFYSAGLSVVCKIKMVEKEWYE